eukprot:COSAG01_NODE_70187_length_259_cov_0.650000_1_plen_68_part_01
MGRHRRVTAEAAAAVAAAAAGRRTWDDRAGRGLAEAQRQLQRGTLRLQHDAGGVAAAAAMLHRDLDEA